MLRVGLALNEVKGRRFGGFTGRGRGDEDFERWVNELGLEAQESVKLLLIL
jgi:hypothetical protein